ncbi:MAG: ATP-dependent DNA helicase RecG, partial [Planctomycetota bacterium]
PKQEDLRSVIRAICAWRSVTSAQLAGLLDRQQDALVRDHLKKMIESGQLMYTIPEMSNHPDQAYTSATKDTENE